MDPSHKVDGILEDWDTVASQARRPAAPPRGIVVRSGPSGATLAGASLLVVAVVIAGVWLGRPGSNGVVGGAPSTVPNPSATPAATPSANAIATAAPTPSPAPTVGPCAPGILRARTTQWEGAAGHRIGHIELTNAGSAACTVETMARPQLVDGAGTVLIDGSKPTSSESLTVPPSGTLKTLVQDGNYCGPAPVAPVTVAFVLSDGGRFEASPASARDVAGVPPCLGAAGSAGDIEMHPWAP